MVWTQAENSFPGISSVVFNSTGSVVFGPTGLGWWGWNLDIVELTSNSVLVAGRAWDTKPEIYFSIVNPETLIHTAHTLENPAAYSGSDYVSVTTDSTGHGILTWQDYDWDLRHSLYYALVDPDGNILTQPMIFQAAKDATRTIQTSYVGYGNTSNSLVTPTSQSVDLRLTAPIVAGGLQGSFATIPVTFGNMGVGKASSVILTATLDGALSIFNAQPAPTSVVGNVATWELGDMDFQGSGKVILQVSVPTNSIGAKYPIQWDVSSSGPDANPADNTATTNVMESIQVYLPCMFSPE